MSYKIGSVCAVYGCKNYKQQNNPKSFFRMPKNKHILKKWIVNCKRKDLDELLKIQEPDYFYNRYVICSDHFKTQCFRNKNLFSQGLFPGSVPTLNLYKAPKALERKNPDGKIFQDSCKKIKTEAESGDILNCETSNDEGSTRAAIEALQKEIVKLKLAMDRFKKKLNYRTSFLCKYKRDNTKLKRKLLKSKR